MLDAYRRDPDATSWDLPVDEPVLSSGVFPLIALNLNNRRFYSLGSSFCIGRRGIVMTATHSVKQGMKDHHWDEANPVERRRKNYVMKDMLFHVLVLQRQGAGHLLAAVSLTQTAGNAPGDLTIGTMNKAVPTRSAILTFQIPLPGDLVTCVGYCGNWPLDGIPASLLPQDAKSFFDQGAYKFSAYQGEVLGIFTERFDAGYAPYPCFAIGVEVAHGVSGGPVFNADGNICGVVMADASLRFNRPATLIAPLYLGMMIDITPSSTFDVTEGALRSGPLRLWIADGTVRTDGTEKRVAIRPAVDGHVVHPPGIPVGPGCRVYRDFAAYQDGVEEPSPDGRT